MDARRKLLNYLRSRDENILLRSEAASFAAPAQVDALLAQLVQEGLLERVNQDVFAFHRRADNKKNALVGAAQRENKLPVASSSVIEQETSVTRYVQKLAKHYNVQFRPTYSDQWARSVTQLAGDTVQSDATDDLLVALTRAGRLSPIDMTKLVVSHHREARGV